MDTELRTLLEQIGDTIARLRAAADLSREKASLYELESRLRALLARAEELTEPTWRQQSPESRLASLRALDSSFRELDRAWSALLSAAGAEVAAKLLAGVDVEMHWQLHWHPIGDDAWAERMQLALDEPAHDEPLNTYRRKSRADYDLVNSRAHEQLILDLRYATSESNAAIAAMFALSTTAIQTRVAAFEARVAETITRRLLAPQLTGAWTVATLPSARPEAPPQLVLQLDRRPDTSEVVLQIVPEWPRRMLRSGRPRDLQRFARPDMRARGAWLWTILVVPESGDTSAEPVLIFVPPRGEYARTTPVKMDAWYAKRLHSGHETRLANSFATLSLAEAVESVLSGREA